MIVRIISSDKHTAWIMAEDAVSTGRVAGNSCSGLLGVAHGCFRNVARVALQGCSGCQVTLAWDMLGFVNSKK